MKTKIEKEGRVWRWEIEFNGEFYGGYCKTKADAESDAGIIAERLRK